MMRRKIEEEKQEDDLEEEECKNEVEEQRNERRIDILMEHSYDVNLCFHICKISNISKNSFLCVNKS